MNHQNLADAVVTTLLPYLPALMGSAAKVAKEVLSEQVATLWGHLKGLFFEKEDMKAAATLVSTDPTSTAFRDVLTSVLTKQLENDPALATRLLAAMGGTDGAMSVIARRNSSVRNVYQESMGGGEIKVVSTDSSSVDGVTQIKR